MSRLTQGPRNCAILVEVNDSKLNTLQRFTVRNVCANRWKRRRVWPSTHATAWGSLILRKNQEDQKAKIGGDAERACKLLLNLSESGPLGFIWKNSSNNARSGQRMTSLRTKRPREDGRTDERPIGPLDDDKPTWRAAQPALSWLVQSAIPSFSLPIFHALACSLRLLFLFLPPQSS